MASVWSDDGAELSPSIWSMLPEDILEVVLERVPFSSLIQFRVVCKQWNSVIMSSNFTRACQKQETPKCVLMLVANNLVESSKWIINIFNPERNTWLSCSLSFLQTASPYGHLYLTASSGGLMCFETPDRRNFIICNPITRRWRRLQLPNATGGQLVHNPSSCQDCQDTNYLRTLTGLIVDQQTGNYKLIVASLGKCPERNRKTLVYDSAHRSWSRGADVPEGKQFIKPGALTYNGNLHCLVENPKGLDAGLEERKLCTWKILTYKVGSDTWYTGKNSVVLRQPRPTRMQMELVEYQSQVLLVVKWLRRKLLSTDNILGVWYGTFFYVCESSLTIVNDRRLCEQALHFDVKVKMYPGSCVGIGDSIYTTGSLCFNSNEVQVLKVNLLSEDREVLPDWRSADLNSKMEMEIRLLEPSLIAEV